MSLKRRLITGVLLSLTMATVGIANEAEAKGFYDVHDQKLELIKLKKLKEAKSLHFGKHHHVKKVHPVKFKKSRSFGRRRFRRSSFGKKKVFFGRY